MPKILNLTSFWKPTACGQTVLPDGSVLIGQKLVKNAKTKKEIKSPIFETNAILGIKLFLSNFKHTILDETERQIE